jgi:uncharacterized protein (TIGR03435 family)
MQEPKMMKISCNIMARTLAIIAIAACALTSVAQPPAVFEVVSIHRNPSGADNTRIDMTHGRLAITNASLKTLIRNAYDIQSYQLAGGPGWLDSDGYDIAASTGTGEETSQDQYRALIRTLLTDRFRLKVHWQTRQANIYALVVAKNGPTLREGPDPSKAPGLNTNRTAHEGRMVGTNAPSSYLASALTNQLSRTVLDKTGLQGKYDWTLVWDPDPTVDSANPSLFTAVQEQLGLRLDTQKGPTEVLVIDSVERPSAN